MILKASNFIPAPEGLYDAVCVDCVDLGIVQGMYGKKHKIRLVFQLDAKMEDGKRFIVGQGFGASLGPKSNLRKFLKTWRGRDFTAEELKGFDMENVVGVPCQLVIAHNEKEGEIYANIGTVMKAKKKMDPDKDYTRVINRDPKQIASHEPDPAIQDDPGEPF